MSITLGLPRDTAEYIASRARVTGLPAEKIAVDLLHRAAIKERFDRAFGPVQKGFEAAGLSDAELDQLIEEVRNEIWREKHGVAERA